MKEKTFKLFKIVAILYGALVIVILGSFFISLLIHGDLMLVQTPHRFDWIAGDVTLLLIILWGFIYALAGLIEKKALAILSILFALIIVVITGWNNWQMGIGSWWGVLGVLILFLLPSGVTYMMLFQWQSGSEKR